MKKTMTGVFLLLFWGFLLPPAGTMAVEPDEILKDPVLEARAREISLNLRCLVCQNQSIDDSNAELARDLRVLVRERLLKGETNKQVTDFIVDRYGEFVLLKPRMSLHTVILWFGPLVLLLSVLGYFFMNWSARQQAARAGQAGVSRLSSEEKKRLAGLLDAD